MKHAWTVICEPIADNEGKNLSGIGVVLTDGDERREVTRVAFARRNSKHPDVSFEDQLTAEVQNAETAAVTLNEFEFEAEQIAEEAAAKARKRLRDLIGKPPARTAKPA